MWQKNTLKTSQPLHSKKKRTAGLASAVFSYSVFKNKKGGIGIPHFFTL
jgi:hypothetical protein